jgi:hypothetical protein
MHQTLDRETSAGRLSIQWGINRWVLTDIDGRVVQRRVKSWQALEAMFVSLGIPPDEAIELAVREWAERPPEAGLSSTDTALGLARFTGVPGWVFLPVLTSHSSSAPTRWFGT